MGGYRIEDFEAQRLAVLQRSLAPNPAQSFNERTVTRSMSIMFVPGQQIQHQVQPPVPQEWLPPRRGFEHIVPSIEDVVDDQLMKPRRRTWMTGSSVRPTPEAPRSTYAEDTWNDASGVAPNRYNAAML